VLEHTYDPVTFLRTASAKLAPGGVLALQVPSYDLVEDYRARGQVSGIVCAVHNFYFTEASLRQVLMRTDLQPLRIETDREMLLLTAICTKQVQAVTNASLLQRLRALLRRE
jgi:hypothetical protein